jgi:hypothetical protein
VYYGTSLSFERTSIPLYPATVPLKSLNDTKYSLPLYKPSYHLFVVSNSKRQGTRSPTVSLNKITGCNSGIAIGILKVINDASLKWDSNFINTLTHKFNTDETSSQLPFDLSIST